MSSRFYYEPFYSLDEFHRLFDDAFNTRTSGRTDNSALTQRPNETSSGQVAKPRYVAHSSAALEAKC